VFLVVGQRGSEARLVADALDHHPDLVVAGSGELIVPLAFLLQRVGEPEAARRLAADLVVAHRGYADGIGRHLDPDAVHAALAGVPTRLGAVLVALYDAVAEAAGAHQAGTLLPVMGNPVLNRTGLYDAGIQLVHVVRDPRTVVATSEGHQTATDIARQWDQANRLFRERRGGDPHRYRLVRLEDAERRPSTVFAGLAGFLGVGAGDLSVAATDRPPALDPQDEATVLAVAREGLFEFGYEPPVGSPRRWARLAVQRVDRLQRRAGKALATARDRAWALRAPGPWVPPTEKEALAPVWCNVCRWTGKGFAGQQHAESADCPRCGCIARERFHLHGLDGGGRAVLETTPRQSGSYARAMRRWFDYSVLDTAAADGPLGHLGGLTALADGSVDDVLCAHDLQAVPDPDATLAELRRVVRPGGRLLLQVPILAATTEVLPAAATAAPGTARWSFGVDLVDRVADAGFAADLLVTDEFAELVAAGPDAWGTAATSGEVDLAGVLGGAGAVELVPVADRPLARRSGWLPAVLFTTIRAVR